MRILTRVTVFLGVLLIVLPAQPALAHNTLVASDPAANSVLASSPATVTLTFDAPVQAGDINQLAVTGPDNTQWAHGPVAVESNIVTKAVNQLGPAGEYVIGYRILSADGHPVSGEIRFSLSQPGSAAPVTTTVAASTADAGTARTNAMPTWGWIVAAILLFGVGLALALRGNRRGRSS